MSNYSIPLKKLAEEFNLSVAWQSTDYEHIEVTVDEVSRPGLPLVGFFEHFEARRLEVLGLVEMTYLDRMTGEARREFFGRLFAYHIPALVISRGQQPHPECLEMAKVHNISVLLGQESTSYIVSGLIASLKSALAPRITRHGVLVEVYGEGLLIVGESGIGKSETAVELLKRGHRLIADDAVEVRRVSNTTLVGSAPENIRHYMELRGVGIINVSRLFGVGSVKNTANVNFVIQLETYDPEKVYDRIGLEEETTEILGMKVPAATIPVQTGRNLAVIIEVATMNYRQRAMGNNSARELMAQLGLSDGQE